MDNPDREFEAFLREFHLRQVRPFPDALADRVTHPKVAPQGRGWLLAAAAVIVVGVLSFSVMRFVGVRPIATVETSGDSSYRAGESLSAGNLVRAGGRESTVFVLEDGSRIEVKPESELFFDRADDDLRLRLIEGSILVSAANQEPAKPLHVESGDMVVTASAGEFLFEARASRKRILVYGGEIEVHRGLTLHKVLPGQQVWTGPSSEEQSLAEAIAWSRSAVRLAGLLPQSSAPPSPVSVEAPSAIAETRHQEQPAQAEPQPQQIPAPVPQPEQPQQQSETPADERGRQILNRECGSCHAVDVVSSRRFGTREAYADLVSRQIAFGASVTDEEFRVLVDYLFKTYGLKSTR
jgi:hypothetical protein